MVKVKVFCHRLKDRQTLDANKFHSGGSIKTFLSSSQTDKLTKFMPNYLTRCIIDKVGISPTGCPGCCSRWFLLVRPCRGPLWTRNSITWLLSRVCGPWSRRSWSSLQPNSVGQTPRSYTKQSKCNNVIIFQYITNGLLASFLKFISVTHLIDLDAYSQHLMIPCTINVVISTAGEILR